jgi:uncharacterized glyoxalase superfamily protein PhnB
MNNAAVPANYNSVMPYLIVANAPDFITFATTVLGATEQAMHLRDDGRIMHAELRIGNSVLMVAEATEDFAPCPAGMYVYVPNADDSYQRALQLGAASVMPMADKPYGRTGGVVDVWGNTWWLVTHVA